MYSTSSVLFFYGAFLISCGIIAVIFIGMKAKTALASGGISGVIALATAYFLSTDSQFAVFGLVLSMGLLGVFSWRSTKTLQAIFKLIPTQHPDLAGKAIAFLIISLMAVVSLVVSMLQILNFSN
jgi:hypothetical protein